MNVQCDVRSGDIRAEKEKGERVSKQVEVNL